MIQASAAAEPGIEADAPAEGVSDDTSVSEAAVDDSVTLTVPEPSEEGPEEEAAGSAAMDEVPAAADGGLEDAAAPLSEEPDTDEADASGECQAESVSDMVDRGVLRRVSDEESVFEMVGNGNSMVEDDFSDLDGVVREIAEKVGRSSEFVSFVRSSDSDMTHYLEDVIRRSWEKQRQDGKDKMFSVYDYSLSILIATQKVMDEIRVEELLNNAGAVMYSRQKSAWNALILSFDDDSRLLSAEERKITPSSFSPSDWKICRIVGEQLIARGKE